MCFSREVGNAPPAASLATDADPPTAMPATDELELCRAPRPPSHPATPRRRAPRRTRGADTL